MTYTVRAYSDYTVSSTEDPADIRYAGCDDEFVIDDLEIARQKAREFFTEKYQRQEGRWYPMAYVEILQDGEYLEEFWK